MIGETQARDVLPNNLLVKTIWDESEDVKLMLNDQQNNILSAIILVVVVIIAILGVRTSRLVGVSIPGSFDWAIGTGRFRSDGQYRCAVCSHHGCWHAGGWRNRGD